MIQDPSRSSRGRWTGFSTCTACARVSQTAVTHPNRFASSGFARFSLRGLREAGCAREWSASFQLKVGEQIVALRIGFAVGTSLYLYYSGFDDAWARYSVMTTTVAEAIKYAIAQRLQDRQSLADQGRFEDALEPAASGLSSAPSN